MGNCGATERNRIKYIPGYEQKVYGVLSKEHHRRKRFRHWGMTMEMIDEFIEECGGREKLEGLSTREVCNQHLVPLTRNKHKVRVNDYEMNLKEDMSKDVEKEGDEDKEKFIWKRGAGYVAWKRTLLHPGVTDADIFVCHAWDDNFLDMVQALNFHLGAERTKARVWIDLFCNNQHKSEAEHIRKHSSRWLTSTMKHAIGEIDRFVVILGQWEYPRIFSRAWSLLEMYYAIEQNRSLEIVLNLRDITPFRNAISEESPMTIPYTYFRMLGQVDFRSAECTHRYQLKLILKAIKDEASKDNVSPVLRANTIVMNFFKNWVIRESTFTIMDAKKDANQKAETQARESMANIFRFDGRPEVATEVYHEALEVRLAQDPECLKADTVRTMYLVANSLSLNRDVQKAADMYLKVLKCQMAPLEAVNNDINEAGPEDMRFIRKLLSHPDTLLTIRNLCGELYSAGRIDDLFGVFNDVYDKYRDFLGTSYVIEYDDGEVERGVLRERIYLLDADNDLVHGQQVEVHIPHQNEFKLGKVQESEIDTSHPIIVQVGNCLGFLHYQEQAWEDAEPFILDALEVRKKHLGANFSDTLVTLRMYAHLLEETGELRNADRILEKNWRASVSRWRKLDEPNLVAKLELHDAAYLYASFLLRHGDAEVARQKFDLERYAMETAKLLGWRHPDSIKMRDLYVDVLGSSQVKDRNTKSSEFLVEYNKLRWGHNDDKIIIVADKGAHQPLLSKSSKGPTTLGNVTLDKTPGAYRFNSSKAKNVRRSIYFSPMETVKEKGHDSSNKK